MTFNDNPISAIEKRKNGFIGVDIPSSDLITNCMHCGLCLPTCPTYALTGLEKSSPRGRIRLIKAVADGDLPITQGFIDEMHFCLDCQACETACPAGVKYGALVEASRTQIEQQDLLSWRERFWKGFVLKWIFLSNRRVKSAARLLRFYQKSGFDALVRTTKVLHFISPKMAKLQSVSPRISKRFSDEFLPEIVSPSGERKYRVG